LHHGKVEQGEVTRRDGEKMPKTKKMLKILPLNDFCETPIFQKSIDSPQESVDSD